MENQNQKQSEEIDLLELFQRMGKSIRNGVNWLIKLVYHLFLLIIRKSLWIGIFILIGSAIGITLFSTTSRYYTSEMIAKCNSTDNYIVLGAINKLNDLCVSRDIEMLARSLQMTTQQAKNIKSINAFYGIDLNRDSIADYIDYLRLYNAKDTSLKLVKNMVFVKVAVYNEDVFTNLRDGLKKYISNNPYIAESNLVRKEQADALIDSYNQEIKKLDSLQKFYYFSQLTQKTGSSQMMFINEKEVKLFHQDLLNLVTKKQKIEKSLTLDPDPITIIQDFTAIATPLNPWTKYIKTWALSFALLGFIVAILWQYRKKIAKLIKEKQY